jgi:hypothetical protein
MKRQARSRQWVLRELERIEKRDIEYPAARSPESQTGQLAGKPASRKD